MLKLVVYIIILVAVCSAQEYLTCLRTNDVLAQPSTQTPQRALQGSPGERGPRGQIGSRGYPGQKGEPGIPDNHQINLLRDQINVLSQKLETLKNQSRKNQLKQQVDTLSEEVQVLKNQSSKNQLKEQVDYLSEDVQVLKNQSRENHQQNQLKSLVQEVETLKNQSRENRQLLKFIAKESYLYIPPYFYIYRLTPGRQSWQRSRRYCQNWGGDLAVHGVKTMQNRKRLINILPITSWIWIGANDIALEGNWIWVNGERASSSELIWDRNIWPQPDGGDNHDCVYMFGGHDDSNPGFAGDHACTLEDPGLCEKRFRYFK